MYEIELPDLEQELSLKLRGIKDSVLEMGNTLIKQGYVEDKT
jgi:hypothetical protein